MARKKLWGGRFKKEMPESVFAFCKGDSADFALFGYDVQASLAHCKALKKAGILSQAEYKALTKALSEILVLTPSPRDIEQEDVHSFVQDLVQQRAGDAYKKLHTARSRNDLVATDSILWISDLVDKLQMDILSIEIVLVEKAQQYIDVYMPFFTHLQDAQVISVAHYLLSWTEAFEDARFDLTWVDSRLSSPLGACAGAGSSIPIDVEALAQEFGDMPIYDNSLFAVSDRSYYLRALFAFANIAVVLSRLAEDWILYSSSEFGFLVLPDTHSTGSSIMPHKKNPDVLELIRGRSSRIIGMLNSMMILMKAQPTAYNRDLQEDKSILLLAYILLSNILEVMPSLIKGIEFNEKALNKALENDFLYATDIMEELILKGISSRDAHEMLGKLVLACEREKKRLSELSEEERSQVLGIHNFTDKQWKGFFDPKSSVMRKKTKNSTSPKSVKSQIKSWQEFFKDEM